MSKISTLTLKGHAGQSYNFDVYAWGTSFRSLGAVYAITKRTVQNDGAGTHDVLYIGQTGDLSERVDNHHKLDCFERHGVNCIGIHIEEDEDSRLAKETDLIRGNKTSCND